MQVNPSAPDSQRKEKSRRTNCNPTSHLAATSVFTLQKHPWCMIFGETVSCGIAFLATSNHRKATLQSREGALPESRSPEAAWKRPDQFPCALTDRSASPGREKPTMVATQKNSQTIRRCQCGTRRASSRSTAGDVTPENCSHRSRHQNRVFRCTQRTG